MRFPKLNHKKIKTPIENKHILKKRSFEALMRWINKEIYGKSMMETILHFAGPNLRGLFTSNEDQKRQLNISEQVITGKNYKRKAGERWGVVSGERWQREYSLLMLPASALMLFRPTVAPARPCRVPREVREFMAPALELAVVPAAGGEGGLVGGRGGGGVRRRETQLSYGNSEWMIVFFFF